MTPEQIAERITRGVEEQYVSELLRYVTGNFQFLHGEADPMMWYQVRRIYDLMPDEMARIYLGYQARILEEATTLVALEAWDEGTETALRAYTGHEPGLVYSAAYQRVHDVTVAGCAEIINRQNVALMGSMADLWYETSIKAVGEMVTYSKGRNQIIQEAVSSMRGLTEVVYESGARYPVDSAIRRHIETQLNQNHQRLTDLRAAEYGWELFMCSAHEDCRPTHYDFQGKLFSKGLHIGDYIDGEMVWDYEELGVGSVEGIYGANCRHYLTPYVPGYSEPQQPPYDAEMNEERYDLTQKQRARERRVRADKLELYAAQRIGDQDAIAQAKLRVRREQASIREFCKEHNLIRRYDLERAYAVPDD